MNWTWYWSGLAVGLLAILCANTVCAAHQGQVNGIDEDIVLAINKSDDLDLDHLPRDCSDLPTDAPNGVYTLRVEHGSNQSTFQAFCEMDKDGGSTVFQRRNGSGLEDFYRFWKNYKEGFGDLLGEFWLGLEKLHLITAYGNSKYVLIVEMENSTGTKTVAEYPDFLIGSEYESYKLNLSLNRTGNATDGMDLCVDGKFLTRDRDNVYTSHLSRGRCAWRYKTAWWVKRHCGSSSLNGLSVPLKNSLGQYWNYTGIWWYDWSHGLLTKTQMKIRRVVNGAPNAGNLASL